MDILIEKGEFIMRDILPNIILMLLGAAIILVETIFEFDGILGWLTILAGLIFIGAGVLYKSKNPLKQLLEMILNLF